MIPQTYFDQSRNRTFEVQLLTVQPHWACAPLGCKFRVLIGVWNFNCTAFVDYGQGNGLTEKAAFDAAVKNLTESAPGGEDEMMLHG